MKLSQLFFKTFKNPPQDADIASHKLLEQGGYITRLSRGLYIYAPLMWKVLGKLKVIVREELNRIGAQEVQIPEMHPKSIWEQSGRWQEYQAEKLLFALKDREDNEYCLAATHEEAMTFLVNNWLDSYKQLPVILYQISNKYRDEIRPRFGLMRAKVFIMKDGYAFCRDEAEMDQAYKKMRQAYQTILARLGLDYVIVQADSGKIGRGKSEEFQVTADVGEDLLLTCEDYAYNVEKAEAIVPVYPFDKEMKPLQEVDTVGTQTIDSLCQCLKIDPQLILKTIVYKLIYADREEFVAIGIRGDREINEIKITNFFKPLDLQLASHEEVEKVLNAKFGFVGPLNLQIPFYADHSTQAMRNFVCANGTPDKHHINVNWKRDLDEPTYHDFLLARCGDFCPQVPNKTYSEKRGIEIGHIFNLGTKYSEALQANYQNESGKMEPFWMGCYGIGVGRLAQACVEQNHDEKGIIWPKSITPFDVCIIPVNVNNESHMKGAELVYKHFLSKQLDPALDDRKERLGFRLKDSDLIGIPYKIIIGKQFEESQLLEIESRKGDKQMIHLDNLAEFILKTFI